MNTLNTIKDLIQLKSYSTSENSEIIEYLEQKFKAALFGDIVKRLEKGCRDKSGSYTEASAHQGKLLVSRFYASLIRKKAEYNEADAYSDANKDIVKGQTQKQFKRPHIFSLYYNRDSIFSSFSGETITLLARFPSTGLTIASSSRRLTISTALP